MFIHNDDGDEIKDKLESLRDEIRDIANSINRILEITPVPKKYSDTVSASMDMLERYNDLHLGMDVGEYLYKVRVDREKDRS